MQVEEQAAHSMTTHTPHTSIAAPVTIRPATRDDHLGLMMLAALDSAEAPPSGRLLLAEVDGELRAALSLDDGSAIADPFHPTLHILELLRTHARGMQVRSRGRRSRLRLRYALA
jgi:hypothetical protein